MADIVIGKVKRWIPALQIAILALGTLMSFLLSYANGDVSPYLPFISETGAYSPAMCIFSLSLIFGSFIGIIMIFFIFMIISSVSENQIKNQFNAITCVVGIISMVGLAGVAAIPMTTVFWAHLLAATSYFLGSGIYFICITIITIQIYGRSPLAILRLALCACISLLLLLIVILFPISLKRWNETQKIIPALKTPEYEGFSLLLVSSILEWSIVFVITVFTATFYKDLQSEALVIKISAEECKMDSAPES